MYWMFNKFYHLKEIKRINKINASKAIVFSMPTIIKSHMPILFHTYAIFMSHVLQHTNYNTILKLAYSIAMLAYFFHIT